MLCPQTGCDWTTFHLLPGCVQVCKLPRAVVSAPPRATVAPVWPDAPAAIEAGRRAHG